MPVQGQIGNLLRRVEQKCVCSRANSIGLSWKPGWSRVRAAPEVSGWYTDIAEIKDLPASPGTSGKRARSRIPGIRTGSGECQESRESQESQERNLLGGGDTPQSRMEQFIIIIESNDFYCF